MLRSICEELLAFQCLKVRRADLVGSHAVSTTAGPVGPAGDILETLVVPTVLQILGADKTSPTAGINEIIKLHLTGAAILAGPSCGNRFSRVGVRGISNVLGGFLEFNVGNLCTVEDASTTLTSMTEENFICFRTDNVP